MSANPRPNARSSAFVAPFTQLADPDRAEPVIISSAEGVHLTDNQGQRLIDGWSGMVCVGLGYARDDLIDIIADQMRRLSYAHSLYDCTHELPIKLAERLVEITPPRLQHVFFSMCGSDAADTLLKIIRYYHNITDRPAKKQMIALERAYHGASSHVAGLTHFPECHDHFDLPFAYQHHIPSPYDFGANEGASADEVISRSVAALEAKVTELGADNVAAFVCEPVMITAGVIIPPLGWLGAMEEACRRLGVLFMVDEVVTGFGRTGKLFACEWDGVDPDLMFLAKGMASGYMPVGAAMFSGEIYRAMTERVDAGAVFGHGFTHTGHPPSCAVTLKCIELYEGLVDHSLQMGDRLLQGLEALAERDPWVTHVRGRGLCAGLDLVTDKKTGERFLPEQKMVRRVQKEAHRRGLMLRVFDGDMCGFAPPLIISKDEVDEMVAITGEAIEAVRKETSA